MESYRVSDFSGEFYLKNPLFFFIVEVLFFPILGWWVELKHNRTTNLNRNIPEPKQPIAKNENPCNPLLQSYFKIVMPYL